MNMMNAPFRKYSKQISTDKFFAKSNIAINTLLILLFAGCFTTGFSQDISELGKRNGFKEIKLGMIIDSLKGCSLKKEFLEKDEFPAKLYSVDNPEYQKIGEVKVNKIEVKTYKDLIYEISVITDKDQRMMRALESIYGKSDYDIKKETYFWKNDNIILKFRSHSKNHLELQYISMLIYKNMKEDKNQKVDDIAHDF